MTIKTEQVKNKYDQKAVQATLNDFFTQYLEDEFKAAKEWKIETSVLVLRAILAVVIVKSYFHAAPFPQDKLLILGCLVAYWAINLVLTWVEKYRTKNFFGFFEIEKANLPQKLKSQKIFNGKNEFEFKVGSESERFSSKYTLILETGNKKVEKSMFYENYMDKNGNLNLAKLKEFFNGTLESFWEDR